MLTGSLDGIVNMEEVGKSMGKVWMGKRESEMGGKGPATTIRSCLISGMGGIREKRMRNWPGHSIFDFF